MSHRDRYLYDLEQEKMEKKERLNWAPLLLLPLFVVLGWSGYQWTKALSASSTNSDATNSMEFGIGGAPPVTLGPSPSISSISPTGNTYHYQAPIGSSDTGSRVGGW